MMPTVFRPRHEVAARLCCHARVDDVISLCLRATTQTTALRGRDEVRQECRGVASLS